VISERTHEDQEVIAPKIKISTDEKRASITNVSAD
jgi:hypothetical protein